jgi:chemotaxis response regulator CheB
MEKDICKFDLLIATTELDTLDQFGMMIYSKCPNFNLLFAANILDAINKIKLHAPDVMLIDGELRKLGSFKNLEEVLNNSKSTIFYLIESESHGLPFGSADALTLPKTISPEELQKRLNSVAVELFWKKAAAAGAVKSVPSCEGDKEQR